MPTERDILEALVAPVSWRGDVDAARRRGDRIRRTRRAMVGAAAVVVLALGGVTAAQLGAGDENSQQVDIVDTPSTTSVADDDLGEWLLVAHHSEWPESSPRAVWSGSELLTWGYGAHALDPATRTWRTMAEPPAHVRAFEATVVFTDREMVVVSGELHSGGTTHADAYDPASDTWRPLADPPFEIREGMFTAWTGSVVIFYGGVAGDTVPDRTGFVYDPAPGEWRTIPESPLGPRAGEAVAWTGSELVVLGGSAQKTSADPYAPKRDGAAYDIATDTWRMLPENPFGDTRGVAYAIASYVVVPDLRCDDECSSAAMLDVGTGSWTDLPATAEVNQLGASFGGAVLRWGTSEGWAYVPSTGELHQLAPLPVELQMPAQRVAVATDDRILVFDEKSVWEFHPPPELVDAALREQRREQERQAAEAAASARAQHAEAAAMEAARLLAHAGHTRDPETFEALPLADSVAVYRSTELLGTRSAEELRGDDGWMFGGVDLLEGLRASDAQNIGPKTTSPCLGSPPDPTGTEGLTRMTILRGDAPSCAKRWAYDVYVDDGGDIVVVRLDG
jgi:hypothetical protein